MPWPRSFVVTNAQDEQRWVCEYKDIPTGHRYSFDVYARSKNKARKILKQLQLPGCNVVRRDESLRGNQNRIATWAPKREATFRAAYPKVMHHVCFVANMAAAYTQPPAHLIVGDSGILHTMAHALHIPEEPADAHLYARDVLVSKIANLEEYVHWMWPGDQL